MNSLRVGQKCRPYSLTSRRHLIVSPIVFWLRNSKSLATYSGVSLTQLSPTNWCPRRVSSLTQVYHRVLGPLLLYWWFVKYSVIWGQYCSFADDLLLHHLITCCEDFLMCSRWHWQALQLVIIPQALTESNSLPISRKILPTLSPKYIYVYPSCEWIRVSSYRYLGVLNSSNLSWSNCIKDITSKARKQARLLYTTVFINILHRSPYMKILYAALIHSHVRYAVPVWDPHLSKDIDTLESAQRFL